jgi:drug/metabolite transporter (DMT)-like permease
MKEPDMSDDRPARHSAGAFDIRIVIAALFGFYGIVLIIMGIVGNSAQESAKTGGVDANLWSGIGVAVVAVVFVVWTRLRPVLIERPPGSADDDHPPR